MARKRVIVCDNCQRRIDPSAVVLLRLIYSSGLAADRTADLCEPCAGALPGQASRVGALTRKLAMS